MTFERLNKLNLYLFRRTPFVILLVLLIGALALFANSLKSPLMLDDHFFFDVHKENIRFVWRQFVPDLLRDRSSDNAVHDAYYRPLAHVIPMLSYLAFGKHPLGHHLVNLFLFWFAAAMVYFFVRRVFADELLAFLTAVFYLVHPVNGIMVNYVTASVFSAQVIFMLAGLMCLWGIVEEGGRRRGEGSEKEKNKRQNFKFGRFVLDAIFSLPSSFVLHLLSILFFALALMCHETAMAFPFYAAAVVWAAGKYSPAEVFRRTFVFFGILFVYFLLRLHFSSLQVSILGQYSLFHMNGWEYLATAAKLVLWYVRQLFSPDGVVIIWAAQVVRSHVALWAGLSVAAVMAAAFVFYKNRRDRPFCLGALFCAAGLILSVPASLFQPTRAMIIEPHWFAFSVIGFFLMVAALFCRLRERVWLLRISASAVILFWAVAGHCYNSLWADEKQYCYYWMDRAPDYAGAVAAHLAKAYEIEGNYGQARIFYRRSLTGHPLDWLKYYSAQGMMCLKERRWNEAEENFKKALAIDPHSSEILNDLGAVALYRGDEEAAKNNFKRSLAEDSLAILPRLNLARMALKKNSVADAIGYYDEVLAIVPHHEIALVKLLQIYYGRGDRVNTLGVCRKLLEHSRDPVVLKNIAVVFRLFGMNDLSMRALSKINVNNHP